MAQDLPEPRPEFLLPSNMREIKVIRKLKIQIRFRSGYIFSPPNLMINRQWNRNLQEIPLALKGKPGPFFAYEFSVVFNEKEEFLVES